MPVSEYARKMIETEPLFRELAEQQETLWINDEYQSAAEAYKACETVVSDADIAQAEARLRRFAPYICRCFPETAGAGGLIESPLREIPAMKRAMEKTCRIPGRLFLKMDSHLPIAGSVKARGGIHEVLMHAETLAVGAGLVTLQDDYTRFADADVKAFLGGYTVQVGSTGNLGLSIGIMSAKLGFRVRVHMSADAMEWKKELLRSKGVEVIEYADDYSKAVQEGRRCSEADPRSYFVDDEYSIPLFLGYAVAAGRLKKQLDALGIAVDAEHPLMVYIPCGVGGAPGGICYGLKRVFGDAVHVFFCEPTLYPSVLLGMATGRYEKVSVTDFGLGGLSAADGLACASPSGLVTRIDRHLLSGDFTVLDERLFDWLRMLKATENVLIEPSSCAAFAGPQRLMSDERAAGYRREQGLNETRMASSTQIVWATGGMLVPQNVWEKYLLQGEKI